MHYLKNVLLLALVITTSNLNAQEKSVSDPANTALKYRFEVTKNADGKLTVNATPNEGTIEMSAKIADLDIENWDKFITMSSDGVPMQYVIMRPNAPITDWVDVLPEGMSIRKATNATIAGLFSPPSPEQIRNLLQNQLQAIVEGFQQATCRSKFTRTAEDVKLKADLSAGIGVSGSVGIELNWKIEKLCKGF